MSRVVANTARVMVAATSASLDQINSLCDTMSAIASKNSPVDTGNNRDSIATKTGMEGGKPVGRVYTQSGYGGWLEIGTSRMAARPYLAPAYKEAKNLTR
jgi:HK97 gp10 family phage protein